VRLSAKADYAVRAAVELADAPGEKPVKTERIATAQGIPLNFLENILGELRHAGIVRSHRGVEGGFQLARPADQISIADILRSVEGPLATVRGGTSGGFCLSRGGERVAAGVDRVAQEHPECGGAGNDR
jgi:Rrf2 family protein